jgi:hypothetical protein
MSQDKMGINSSGESFFSQNRHLDGSSIVSPVSQMRIAHAYKKEAMALPNKKEIKR